MKKFILKEIHVDLKISERKSVPLNLVLRNLIVQFTIRWIPKSADTILFMDVHGLKENMIVLKLDNSGEAEGFLHVTNIINREVKLKQIIFTSFNPIEFNFVIWT